VHPFLKAAMVPVAKVFMNCRSCMFATAIITALLAR
jgi:hypothetical protein